MQVERTKFAFENIKEFFERNGRDPLVESFLVQYLIVNLYSEMEKLLAQTIRARLAGVGDGRAAEFIAATNDAMIRRVKKAEINDVLKKFGCDEIIDNQIDGVNLQPYFDAIAGRHLVTHGDGCSMTLEEFECVLPCADLILESVQQMIAN